MNRRFAYFAAWLLVTAGATAAASEAVLHVASSVQVSPDRSLSSRQVSEALRTGQEQPRPTATARDAPGGSTTATTQTVALAAPPAGAAPAAGAKPGPTTTLGATASRGGAASGSSPAGVGGSSPAGPPPGGSQAAPAGGTGEPAGGSSTTTTSPPVEVTKVFSAQGGVATVSCRGSVASLVSSSPQTGFTETIDSAGPQQVELTFRSSTHQSEIQAICTGGQPSAEISESSGSTDS